jgi:cytochrome c oxidase subunit 2
MMLSRSRMLMAALLIAPGEARASWQSALDPQGAPAGELAWLINVFFIICAIIWILVVATLGASLLRRRAARDFAQTDGSRRALTIAVSIATIATTLIVSGLTFASYFTTRGLAGAPDNPVSIRMRGHQWWWEATYEDSQTGTAFVTANELHIPVGQEIRVKLSAADVIHSFWVPSLAGKVDLIPGRDNEISFTARRAGIYRGQCAEFCGVQHAHMSFLVIAEEPAAFEAWRRGQIADTTAPTDADERRGRDLFLNRQCAACHTVRGTSAVGKVGPDLTHVGSRRTIAAGLLPTTRGSLAAWTADPQTLKPGSNMPMVPLSSEDLKAVSAWMAGLQ